MFVQIIKPGTEIDFLGKWRIAFALSLSVILIGLVSIPLRGFRLGIDFAGGTEVQLRFIDSGVEEGAVRAVVNGLGIKNASVIRYGDPAEAVFLIKFGGERTIAPEGASEPGPAAGTGGSEGAEEAEPTSESRSAAAPAAGDESGALTPENDRIVALESALDAEIGALEIQRVEFVGPKVGAELRDDGLMAMAIACLLILVYIAFRFSARFAPGAVVALVHDVLVTASVWVVLGLEFDLKVLAALLAIIGYSLNDTIIVYDRVRENMEIRTKHDLLELLNRSVNQTLSRTLLTSITTLGVVLVLLFLGGSVIRPFALAMSIGVVVGTYSSIYIAGPTLLLLETRIAGETPTAAPAKAPAKGGGRPKKATRRRKSGRG